MKRTYEEWLKYYENATKEQVIFDMMLDMQELENLHSIIKEVREYIDEHAKWDYSGGTEENHIAEWYDLDITSSMFIGELLEILDKEKQCTNY